MKIGEPDDGSRYYEYWLTALERLVTTKRLTSPTTLLTRKAAWVEAYRNTPPGKPVELCEAPRRPDGRWPRSLGVPPWARCSACGTRSSRITLWLYRHS